jgi:hypothetical protein
MVSSTDNEQIHHDFWPVTTLHDTSTILVRGCGQKLWATTGFTPKVSMFASCKVNSFNYQKNQHFYKSSEGI